MWETGEEGGMRSRGPAGDTRIKSLDGLRGVAIILVLLFHGTVPGFSNAWIGVDIFFVLSGYLITKILVSEYAARGSISLTEFYKRRALRLTPALFLMCALFLAYALFFLPIETARLRETTEALLYVSNWSQAFQFKVVRYVGHAWSLGIEEQFYLLWPLSLLLLLRGLRGTSAACVTTIILALTAALWRAWLWSEGASPERLYNGFDTRCDSIFVGCAFAFVAPRLAAFWPLGVVGVLAALLFGRWNASFMFLGGYTVLAVSAALVIAGATRAATLCDRVLELRPLVATGRISYGLYLFHFPVYAVIVDRVSWNPWYLNFIGLPIAAVLAIVSYISVEQPTLRLRNLPMSWASKVALALLGPVSVVLGAVFIGFWYP